LSSVGADGDVGLLGLDAGDLLGGGFVAGIDLSGAQELGERAHLVALIVELATLGHVGGGCGLAQPVVTLAKAKIRGRLGVSLFVGLVGGIVVLTLLRGLALGVKLIGGFGLGDDGYGERAAHQRQAEGQRERAPGNFERNGEAVHQTPIHRIESWFAGVNQAGHRVPWPEFTTERAVSLAILRLGFHVILSYRPKRGLGLRQEESCFAD